MAKDFSKSRNSRTFESVGKASAERANVVTVKNITNDKLNDYPNNREDTGNTADLEKSISELGFTDPLEVTGFDQPEGMYMIVSGHRRRAAGIKCGLDIFPCIVKSFKSPEEVSNYVLMSNSQRDSAKDPLLFSTRYKMHEDYLKGIGFKGNMREEISRRLGISVQQADRYNAMNKVIQPVWEMVRSETVGMTSVMPLAAHTHEEQGEILAMLNECIAAGDALTRDAVKKIVDGYRDGIKSYSEMHGDKPGEEENDAANNAMPEPDEDQNAGDADESNVEGDNEHGQETEEAGPADEPNSPTEEDEGDDADPQIAEEGKAYKAGSNIAKYLVKLNKCFDGVYSFEDAEDAESVMSIMSSTICTVIDQLYSISQEHALSNTFKKAIDEMLNKIREY